MDAVNASGHIAADISTSMSSSESDNNLNIDGDHDDDQSHHSKKGRTDVVCFITSLITIPLAMLATSLDSFYWRAVNVTAGMMIGSAVLLYASVFGWVTDIEQAATLTTKIGLIMFILFCCIICHRKASHRLVMMGQ
ncbi:hypothetical protein LWI29_027976 [Acer saccharum]|uniref:Uncharacterized protein n=1 Tax=Acer saccharum TaxID=4024 RepID=A0AA39SD22_ACESA|nr:hypothetical protein LWI29_027976 [Acer saccharum]